MLNHSNQTILKYTLGAELGTIHLKSGAHQIEVALQNPSADIFLAIYPKNSQVCGAGHDEAAAVPNEDGFTLFADVESDSTTVFWMAF